MNTLDQYYISPEAERRHEIERAESIEDTRTSYAEDLDFCKTSGIRSSVTTRNWHR